MATTLALTAAVSPWAPFRRRVFAVVWTASLVAAIGTWIRDVGAGWLMTSLSPSVTMVAMVQVATTLPIFLLSLPAGALADIVDRRRLMIGINAALAIAAALLGVLTAFGVMTPALLVAGIFVAGIGTALVQPVQQSLTPMLVERGQLRSAVALGSMGFNVARAIGPALGGLLLVHWGVASTFFVDALSYLAPIGAFVWWKGASVRPGTGTTPEQLGAALRAGMRFALHAPALQRVLLRAGSFFVFASAYWALLPVIARRELGGGPSYYGSLLACVGAGAVAGALLLPRVKKHLSSEATMRLGIVLSIVVLVVLAFTRDRALAAGVMALAGAGWIGVLTTANVAAQTHLPNWVRGRGLAIYLTVFYGAMAGGSFLWGTLADIASVRGALIGAAALGGAALALALWKPLPEGEPDLTPSMHWPEPALGQHVGPADRGPVLVTVEYVVDAGAREAFLAALHGFADERLRDGAYQWGVYEDVEQPGRFVESFLVASWEEHLRQHHRVSRADAELQQRVRRFHLGPDAPRVRHFIAPAVAAAEA
jgi:MFS family permease